MCAASADHWPEMQGEWVRWGRGVAVQAAKLHRWPWPRASGNSFCPDVDRGFDGPPQEGAGWSEFAAWCV